MPWSSTGPTSDHQTIDPPANFGAAAHELRLVRTGLIAKRFDVLHVQVGLRNDEPAEVVCVHAEQPPDGLLGATDVEDEPSQVHHRDVLGSGAVDRAQQLDRDPARLGDLPVRALEQRRELPTPATRGSRGTGHPHRPRRRSTRPRARRSPTRREVRRRARPARRKRPPRVTGTEIHQPPDEGDVDARSLGHVLDRALHEASSSRTVRARPRQTSATASTARRRRRGEPASACRPRSPRGAPRPRRVVLSS